MNKSTWNYGVALVIIIIDLMIIAITVTGCNKPQSQIIVIKETTVITNNNIPTIDITNKSPNGADIDPKSINPMNPGYNIDLDGDGILDFVILDNDNIREGNVLYFSKGNSNGTFGEKIPILRIKGGLIAYCVQQFKDKPRPVLLFWNADLKGYYQDNLGNNENGLPYFGDVEEIK
jgi:hypothetical protein